SSSSPSLMNRRSSACSSSSDDRSELMLAMLWKRSTNVCDPAHTSRNFSLIDENFFRLLVDDTQRFVCGTWERTAREQLQTNRDAELLAEQCRELRAELLGRRRSLHPHVQLVRIPAPHELILDRRRRDLLQPSEKNFHVQREQLPVPHLDDVLLSPEPERAHVGL